MDEVNVLFILCFRLLVKYFFLSNFRNNWRNCHRVLANLRQKSDCTFSVDLCFIHLIFSSFGFWYFAHISCVIFFPFFFRLTHLALQNINKDYVILSYYRNFVAKSDRKPKTKNGMNKTFIDLLSYFVISLR